MPHETSTTSGASRPALAQRCHTCLSALAHRRFAGRATAPGARRLGRWARTAMVAASVAGAVAMPLAGIGRQEQASAGISVPAPRLKVVNRPAGYQLLTAANTVAAFGASANPSAKRPVLRTTAIARTPSGAGSWTAADDGGVFTDGDAPFLGSLGGTRLAAPVVDLSGTRSGQGYWLVAADGGVFTYGDAPYFGGLAGQRLGASIVAITPTRSGDGYWLVGADGGVFAFGGARYAGGLAGTPMGHDVVDLATTATGNGYWVLGGSGVIAGFGDATDLGQPEPHQLTTRAIALTATPSGRGYWLATADGGVFTYGDAPFLGSSSGRIDGTVVALAAGPGRNTLKASGTSVAGLVPVPPPAPPAPRAHLSNRYGNDVSWPQCGGELPAPGWGFSVVGVTDGHPFSESPCLADQWRWAARHGGGAGVYMNVAWTTPGDARGMNGPAGPCTAAELACQAYNASAANVTQAVAYARASGVDAPVWWLDVEIFNSWSPYKDLNAYVVQAAVETLDKLGIRAGIYSSPVMWRRITGGAKVDAPVWLADIVSAADAPGYCGRERSFSGGPIWMVQALPGQFDINWACDPVVADPSAAFSMR